MIRVDPNDPRGIVWIASYPKSGNTWVRVFLHHLLRQAAGKPLEANDLAELRRTSPACFGRIDLFERFLGKPVMEASQQEIAIARPKVQEAVMREADGVAFSKTHCLLGRLYGQPLVNLAVSAGAVYLVRNPLDVAVSLSHYLDESIDTAITLMGTSFNAPSTTEKTIEEVWGSWTENVATWTTDQPPVIHVVRYEDLVAEPRARFTAIVEHMNLDVTEEQIEEAIRLASFERLRKQEEKSGFSDAPSREEAIFS